MQGASGVNDRVDFLMLGFFILTHLAIVLPQLHPCFELRHDGDSRGGSSWTLIRQIKHWSGKIAKEAQISILK